jgi:putative membrane protein (TIGR04086 family)
MTPTRSLRWGRILLGGLFIELAMFAFVIPLQAISPTVLYYSVPFLAIGTAVLFGAWAAKPAQSRHVLHGVLVALVASLIYVSLTTAAGANSEIPLLYHFSHGLRLLGGGIGGWLAARRSGVAAAHPQGT